MRFFIIFALCLCYVNAMEVLVAKKSISYKEVLSKDDFAVMSANPQDIPRTCEVFNSNNFNSGQYMASKYIKEGSLLCTKDVLEYKPKEVLFNFGSLEIKTDGEVINETAEYITIKKHDGSVQKIYKDGRDQ